MTIISSSIVKPPRGSKTPEALARAAPVVGRTPPQSPASGFRPLLIALFIG
jgi:hypothetical protein